ncbi:MAG: hypothetical protein AAGJ52_06030, partial [Pseudomonadota bacterium]
APDGAAPFWSTIEDLIVGVPPSGPPAPTGPSFAVPTTSFYGLLAMALIMLGLGWVFTANRRF